MLFAQSAITSLTGWSSRRPQAPLVGALRASHSGAAYRERSPSMSATADVSFRWASEADLSLLYACDSYSQNHESRRLQLRRMAQQKSCLLALAGGGPLGFAVLEYNFFGNGFVSLICVASEHQGKGVGLSLLLEVQRKCLTGKLFTSTNASNEPAQRLFTRAGFVRSGMIENLDEGDPEVIYFKMVPR